MGDNNVISQIYSKIEREKALINAAVAMRQSSNTQVQASLDAQIKEARKNLDYLEQRLRDQEMRQVGQGMGGMNLGGNNGGPQPSTHGSSSSQQPRNGSFGPLGQPPRGGYDIGSYGPGGTSRPYPDNSGGGGGGGHMPSRPPYGPSAPGQTIPKARPNYSKLDLIKADTQHLGPRFQLMLSQLTFKLTIERQYLDGIEKMIKLYSDEGDRRSRQDALARRTESQQKIQLLSQALKRYEDLHVDMETPDVGDDDSINSPQLRKPLSGHLALRLYGVRDVQHAITGKFSRSPETFAIIKVEDAFKGRTKATRTDKWTDEIHQIEVDKANEIELTVYDKTGPYPTPIGMLWIRISDIVEEMRRKKIESELSGSQWVTAEQMDNNPRGAGGNYGGPVGPGAMPFMNAGSQGGRTAAPTGQVGPDSEMDPNVIDAWFSLEPVGSIRLSMNFTKHNRGKAAFDLGLNRKGAVRQRKEDVVEQYGHKFVTQQFYSIMRCALCGEFLKNAAGMQCEDCKYTCHRNCYVKVVTKCISKSNAETDPDEETLNHRIPHRFEPFSNLSANWCCHCGYMLTFGKKNARKCSECGLTVHGTCAHLVPNFCGMSMQRANEILNHIKQAPKHGPLPRTLRDKSGRPAAPVSPPSYDDTEPQERPVAQPERRSYTYDKATDSKPQESLPQPSQPPAFQPSSDRPQGMRTASNIQSDAANAAKAAISGHPRPAPQKAPSYIQQPVSGYPPSGGRTSSGFSSGLEPEPDHYGADYRHRPTPQPQTQPPQPPYDPSAYRNYGNAMPSPQQTSHPVKPSATAIPPSGPAPQPQQVVKQQPTQPPSKTRVGLEHFNFLAVLGKGNFGKVMLAETKASKKLYAIKVLKKEFIIENDEVESTKSEKRVFLVANKERHPFLLNLHACFQTETRVYFVMEYISGGDLMLHIQRGQFGLKRSQFYASEVCLALKYFHENGVIYRDLKLDNILLTLDGHIKIGDYGLCKEDMWYGATTSTFCGTPEFMAPEILLDKKYGRAVDWWAFGVLIYQMLLQQSPFRGEDEDEIYDAILADEPLYPIHMPRDSVSILQKLLTREPELRLGSGPTDAQEIMSHAFFRNVNWEDVRNLRVPPPFQPSIKSATDTSNFDNEFTSVTPVLTPVQSVLTQAMQEEFRGFSYSADFI